MHRIRLVKRPPVSTQLALVHLERVSGLSDEALHEVLRRILRKLEDDDIAIVRLSQLRQAAVRERDLGAICQLVDEQEIPDEQRALHAPARDLEGLDKEGAEEEEQQHRDRQNLCPLPEEGHGPRATIHAAQRADALLGSNRPGGRR